MTGQTQLPAQRREAPKTQIVAGAPVAALVPQTLEEAFRLSGALAASGMAPRGIDKPEQIMVAILAGAELGLAPFQSLQSFAVVNGRPTLWGDGLLAVVRGRGVKVKEWLDGEGDQMVAHCVATRPDTGEEIEREFSVADAKKAALWAKQGPWQQYPKRMLQMRARALALRDGCADMLRGIQVREEVEDYQHVRDVTPRASGLRERLTGPSGEGFTSANAAPEEPVEFVGQAEAVEAVVEEIVDENVDPPAPDDPPTAGDTAAAEEPDEDALAVDLSEATDDQLTAWAEGLKARALKAPEASDLFSLWSAHFQAGRLGVLFERLPEVYQGLEAFFAERRKKIGGAA